MATGDLSSVRSLIGKSKLEARQTYVEKTEVDDLPIFDVRSLELLDDRLARQVALTFRIIGIFAAAISLILLFAYAAGAHDNGQYDHTKGPPKEWWDKLANQDGGLCCSFADGESVKDVDWDTQVGEDGKTHYRVRLDGEWRVVEDKRLVLVPNLAGTAVVWPYTDTFNNRQVRCFMPGTEG